MEKQKEIHQFIQTFSFVCGCIVVPTAVIGVFLNCLNVFVFRRSAMKTLSTRVLLIGLSVANCVYIIFDTPLFAAIAFYSRENDILDKLTVLMMIYVYPVAMMAQTASIWCLVALSASRFCAKFKISGSHMASCKLLVVIVVGSVIYNFCRFWEYTVDESKDFRPGVLQENLYYVTYYMKWSYFVCMFLIPFGIILISDLALTVPLCQRRCKWETSVDAVVLKGKRQNCLRQAVLIQRVDKEAKSSLHVAVIGLVFIFCHSLAFAINALEIGQRSPICSRHVQQPPQEEASEETITEWVYKDSNQAADSVEFVPRNNVEYNGSMNVDECDKLPIQFLISVDISNVLVHLNYVTNFFVHLIFIRRFRSTFSRWRRNFSSKKNCSKQSVSVNPDVDHAFDINKQQQQQNGKAEMQIGFKSKTSIYQSFSSFKKDEQSIILENHFLCSDLR